MRKCVVIGALACILFPLEASAQVTPDRPDRGSRGPEARKPGVRGGLNRVLRQKVEQVDWEDAPLSDVVDWLRERGEINVVVRWTVLEPLGITPDTPVSLRLRNAPVSTILTEVLSQLSSIEELRFQGIGNTLTISSREDLNRKMYVKAYPVNDLLFRIPDFTDSPAIDLQQAGGGGGGAGGGSATQNPFQGGQGGGGGEQDDNRSKRDRIEELVELIINTVEPDQWRDNGGQATIRAFNDSTIVVRAPLEIHEKLGGPMVIED